MGYCSRACGRVEARFLDLAELSSVVAFAASHAQEPDGIDGLLSNAGGLECVRADRRRLRGAATQL